MNRKEYMEGGSGAHRAYYAQYVTPSLRAFVSSRIGVDRILTSKDPHLNDIPLGRREMNTIEKLKECGACDTALEWVAEQPDQSPDALWATCPNGSWMLWALEAADIDASAVGHWCAERARQSALRVLPASRGRDALAACAPITDRRTAARAARAAADAAYAARAAAYAASDATHAASAASDAAYAARTAYAARAARAAAYAARAAAYAAEAAKAAAIAAYAAADAASEAAYAAEAELAVIADHVRLLWPAPPAL